MSPHLQSLFRTCRGTPDVVSQRRRNQPHGPQSAAEIFVLAMLYRLESFAATFETNVLGVVLSKPTMRPIVTAHNDQTLAM
jgi:hypothetical protein